ncbi:MAG: SLBB domain-containing protein [Bdellovibrionaceae bacterium]|nr:SLBB domain-containing protein [Pseudobdellovibrionaceae bacterium]
MKNIFKKILCITLSQILILQSSALAQSTSSFFEVKEPPRAAEYIFRSAPKETLIGVQLLGAVKNPGVYYIPPTTDLLKLLSLAGGEQDADLTEIIVRKVDPATVGVYELDMKRLMKTTGGKQFKLTQDDFIYVPKKESWISSDVSRTVSILSLLATIVLTGVLIEKNSK